MRREQTEQFLYRIREGTDRAADKPVVLAADGVTPDRRIRLMCIRRQRKVSPLVRPTCSRPLRGSPVSVVEPASAAAPRHNRSTLSMRRVQPMHNLQMHPISIQIQSHRISCTSLDLSSHYNRRSNSRTNARGRRRKQRHKRSTLSLRRDRCLKNRRTGPTRGPTQIHSHRNSCTTRILILSTCKLIVSAVTPAHVDVDAI